MEMILMDDELKRFEDKQKVANFQIDKRLSMIENSIDQLKSAIESISDATPGEVDKVSREVAAVEKEEIAQRREMNKIIHGIDSSKLMDDFSDLKSSFTELRIRFEEKVNEVSMLQEQLVGFERRGKLPQCENGFDELEYKVRLLSDKVTNLEKKIDNIERDEFAKAASQPIIIE